ncbi:MAG TPA: hypothetical protein VGJ60_21395 [Chloroflexota bacterium]
MALVESTTDNLEREYVAQQSTENELMTGIHADFEAAIESPPYAVDFDVIGIIDNARASI